MCIFLYAPSTSLLVTQELRLCDTVVRLKFGLKISEEIAVLVKISFYAEVFVFCDMLAVVFLFIRLAKSKANARQSNYCPAFTPSSMVHL